MGYFGYKPYIPVAVRREKALRQMDKLRKKGMKIYPIEIEKHKITKTFWGSAWCNHIESFSDYENRLPRGRTYVRNGSVCHLLIKPGCVEAIVSGSALYHVCIKIKPLVVKRWEAIKKACTGKIDSLIDLLSGQLSDGVMEVVCDRDKGLFPSPKEIELSCDCPDWATMCKHVAAVLYGVGVRLDHSPEMLFQLRDVNQEELIQSSAISLEMQQGASSKRRRIADSAISDVFDIDLSDDAPVKISPKAIKPKKTKINPQTTTAKRKGNKKRALVPSYFSGSSIRKKRRELGLTQKEFSQRIGVSVGTISNWEGKGRKKINVRPGTIEALLKAW